MTSVYTPVSRDPLAYAVQRIQISELLVAPMALAYLALVFAPLVMLVIQSSGEGHSLNLSTYSRIFEDAYTLSILLSTIRIGVITTVVVAIISYPIALAFLFATARQRTFLIFMVILPLLTGTVVRTFAWIVILGRDGPLNELLRVLAIVQEPVQVLFTDLGVIIAIVQIELPLMILPLVTSLIRIDPNLLLASRSLGAGRWRMFRKIIVPLTLPGLVAGCTLVFSSSVSAFITQAVVGGGKRVYMPLLIYQQAADLHNLPAASALAIVLLLTVCAAIVLFGIVGRSRRDWHYA
jgi:putative spermidine/putrescine transport system permease protein